MAPTLNKEQLFDLTGYRQPSKQVEWLRKELGIDAPVGADGRPRVSQAVIDQATLARQRGSTMANQTNSASSSSRNAPKWTVAA